MGRSPARRSSSRWCVVAAGLALLGASRSPASTFPGANGKIIFVRGGAIWSINPDGSGLQQLTTAGTGDSEPRSSPDGKSIVFERATNVWIMNADGTGQQQLTTTGSTFDPTFSADGHSIVYAVSVVGAARVTALVMINTDGTGGHQLTSDADVRPSFSAGGQHLAFVSSKPQLEIGAPDTSGANPIYTIVGSTFSEPDWAPTGTSLVISDSGGVEQVPAGGGTASTIVPNDTNTYSWPSYSPDGTKLVFSGMPVTGAPAALDISAADGTGRTQIPHTGAGDTEPDWSVAPSTKTGGAGSTTSTSVTCTYLITSGVDTCTATVTAATAPTGTVVFASQGGGAFTAGSSCTLAPTPASGAASCSVQFLPPSSGLPAITATYSGDAQHLSSSAQTQVSFPVEPPGGSDQFPTSVGCRASASSLSLARVASATPAGKACGTVYAVAGGVSVWIGTELEGTILGRAAAAWVQASGATIFIAGGAQAQDPPDHQFGQLALPTSGALGSPPLAHPCAARLSAAECHRLRPLLRGYLTSLSSMSTAQLALGTTGNRLVTARKMHDAGSIALQTVAFKLYGGEAASAAKTLHAEAAALAHAIRRLHLDTNASSGQLKRTIRELADHPPRAVRQALTAVGRTVSSLKLQIKVELPAITRHAPSRTSQLLLRSIPMAGSARDYQSITLENVRDLVRGMARQNLLSAARANTLVLDLTCTSTHGKPSVAQFIKDATKLAPREVAGLLMFTVTPLAHRAAAC